MDFEGIIVVKNNQITPQRKIVLLLQAIIE